MATSTPIPLRIEGIQPILNVRDMQTSRAFYIDILGFREEPWGDDTFTSIRRDNGCIYLCRGSQGTPGTWIWVGFYGDMQELYTRLRDQGVTIRMPPTNYPWALEMHVEDPDGHVLRLGTDPVNTE